MLTVAKPEPDDENDIGQGLVDSVRGLINYASRLQAENSRDYTKSREYNMPTYQDCEISEDSTSKRLTFNFIFNKFGKKLTFNFGLPLFNNLAERSLRVDAIEHYDVADNSHVNKKAKNYEVIILRMLYHPFFKLLVGTVSIANFLSLVAPMAISPIIPAVMVGASLGVKILGLISSVVYATPIIFYYLGADFYKTKLENFFLEIDEDINNNRAWDARYKLANLPFIFGILLDSIFPNNQDLVKKYFKLRGDADLACGLDGLNYYINALKFTDNKHDKLLPLKGIINGYEHGLQSTLWRVRDRYYGDEYEQRCNDSINKTLRWQAPYISQIPTDSPLYNELGSKIRTQIQDCINSLRAKQFKTAVDKFYAIKWDAYSRHAYPDAAVMYYQTEAIITFFSKKKTRPTAENIKYDECLWFGTESEAIIQNILDKYYPEEAQQYKTAMAAYETARKSIFYAKEPQRESPVTVLPDLYTPGAIAAMERAKQNYNESFETRNDSQEDGPDAKSPKNRVPHPQYNS